MTGQKTKGRNLTFLFCFSTFVFCARRAICLIDEKLAVHPTTSDYLSPHVMENSSNASFADYTLPFACGNNSESCMHICLLCHEYFGGPTMDCFSAFLKTSCVPDFHSAMNQSNTDWCVWGNVSGLYSNLSLCTEEISDCLLIPWPNPVVEKTFLDIHSHYFKDCPSEELSDPPPAIVFALVITPICLIPVMVSLVVLKTKNGDGSP